MQKRIPKMRKYRGALLFLPLAAAAITAAAPAFGADADNGRRLAHRWCEACHVVSATQRRTASDQAPTFSAVARRPGLDAAKIALFLLEPHPKMPDMALSRTEAADLAAYIASLK
jgi:mono/diheme cytochrome c family protein